MMEGGVVSEKNLLSWVEGREARALRRWLEMAAKGEERRDQLRAWDDKIARLKVISDSRESTHLVFPKLPAPSSSTTPSN